MKIDSIHTIIRELTLAEMEEHHSVELDECHVAFPNEDAGEFDPDACKFALAWNSARGVDLLVTEKTDIDWKNPFIIEV